MFCREVLKHFYNVQNQILEKLKNLKFDIEHDFITISLTISATNYSRTIFYLFTLHDERI